MTKIMKDPSVDYNQDLIVDVNQLIKIIDAIL